MLGTVLWIIGVICAVWVIIDVWSKNNRDDQTMKIVWTICALLFSIITAIVYYFMRKR